MAENVPPPFSTSQASTKSKRHSLNIISPGPRPLHLASGSVLSSPPHSPSRSPALHNPSADSPVLRAHYCTGPLSPGGARSVKNGRRQSSISYLPSNRDKDSRLPPLSPPGFSRRIALTKRNSAAAGSPGVETEESSTGATNAVTLDALKQLKGRPPATLVEKYVVA